MAEISELGESLLARARSNNEMRAKRNRRQAYNIAFGTAAVGLLNNQLTKRADQFLQKEQVLAAKARYKATADQAAQIYKIRDAAATNNQSMEDYFYESRYLPALQDAYTAKFGEEFTKESYLPQMQAEARRLAAAEAVEFEDALRMADGVPSLDQASRNIDSLVAPPRNAGEALLGKVGEFISGKSGEDVRSEILQRVEEEGLIKNQSAKIVFDKILADGGASAAVDWIDQLNTEDFNPNTTITEAHDVIVNDNEVIFAKVTTLYDPATRETRIIDISHTVAHKGTTPDIRDRAQTLEEERFRHGKIVDARDYGFQVGESLRTQRNVDREFQRSVLNDETAASQFDRELAFRQGAQAEDVALRRQGLALNTAELAERVRSNVAAEADRDESMRLEEQSLEQRERGMLLETQFRYDELMDRQSARRQEFERELRRAAEIQQTAHRTLNGDGYARFNELLAEVGIDATNIESSAENFQKAGEIYRMLSSNPRLLRNDVFDEGMFTTYNNVISSLGNTLAQREWEGPDGIANFVTDIFADIKKSQTAIMLAERVPVLDYNDIEEDQ